jgi:hypothetical protein
MIILEKKRRTCATDYLLKGNDKYICKYPKKDFVKILKNSGYYSEKWKKTDSDKIDKVAVQTELSTSIVIYERWWYFPAVCIFITFLLNK